MTNSQTSVRTRFWVMAAALAVALVAHGCKRDAATTPGGSPNVPAPRAQSAGDLAAAGDEAFSKERAADADHAARGRVDYWKDVRFDVHNFEEIVDYVTTYYIEEDPDTKRAWIAAANNAMALLDPRAELLPTAFYKARSGHADEEGRLDGNTEPFSCGGDLMQGVSLHLIPSLKYLKSKRKKLLDRRLTDDEIRVLRDKDRARYKVYKDKWAPIPFGRTQFRCALKHVEGELAKMAARRAQKAQDLAKKAPAEAAPTAADAPKPAAKTAAATKTKLPAAAKSAVAEPAAVAPSAGDVAQVQAPVALYAPDDEPDAKDADDDDDDGEALWQPDINRAWLAAGRAYLYALDPHSSVISRKAWDESTRKTENNSFEGIGAVLTQRQNRTIVENPMENLPAWKAGVRAGDEIQRVDGKDVRGWLLSKVVDVIRGPKATTVVLTVAREGEPKPLDIAIKRAHIPIKNVRGKLLKHHQGIAYVKMAGFIPSSTRHLRDQLEALKKQAGGQLNGVILDLRGNSGGLLNRAIDIADMFLDDGVIVSVRSRRGKLRGRPEEVHRATPSDADIKVPLIVLVNDGSASASEIVASAIQENGRGLVAGLRTFGKASVQTLFEPALHLDYYIKLTVARYYAPSGRTIQVLGVHPDLQIAPKLDGKIPLGYREENLTNHLDPISHTHVSPLRTMIPALDKCVAKYGRAEKIVKADPHPRIQPDFQLLKSADYLVCLARLRNGR